MSPREKSPLYVYVISVAVIWSIILGLMRFLGHTAAFHTLLLVALGFALGMIAMWIAVHLYKWR